RELLEVVRAGHPCSRLPHLLNSREQEPDEDGNDGDDNEQLDERESAPALPIGSHDTTCRNGEKNDRGRRHWRTPKEVITSNPCRYSVRSRSISPRRSVPCNAHTWSGWCRRASPTPGDSRRALHRAA